MSHLAPADALEWTRTTLQSRLLAELFAERVQKFVLKGGMAMKLRHNSARATQDIDLDALDAPLVDIQKTVRRAIKRATSDGILENIDITEPKQTETTARWKIRGFDPKTRQNMILTVEVSSRDFISENDYDEMYTYTEGKEQGVLVYKNSQLAFKKIKALMSPSREAPRDVSDLYLLIKAHATPPLDLLRDHFAKASFDEVVKTLWNKIESMDQKRFKQEVLPSLPSTPQAQELYKNWDSLRIEVGTTVEEWIKNAYDQIQVPQNENVSALSAKGIKKTRERGACFAQAPALK